MLELTRWINQLFYRVKSLSFFQLNDFLLSGSLWQTRFRRFRVFGWLGFREAIVFSKRSFIGLNLLLSDEILLCFLHLFLRMKQTILLWLGFQKSLSRSWSQVQSSSHALLISSLEDFIITHVAVEHSARRKVWGAVPLVSSTILVWTPWQLLIINLKLLWASTASTSLLNIHFWTFSCRIV